MYKYYRWLSYLMCVVVIITAVPLKSIGAELDIDNSVVSQWNGYIASSFEKGNGSREDPFTISNVGQLAYFAKTVERGETYENKYVQLANDIEMNYIYDFDEWDKNAPVNQWTGIKNFCGVFDGNHNSIIGLYMVNDKENTGFFSSLNSKKKATIQNVNFRSAYVSGTSNVGIIVGNADYITIQNCSVTGIVKGSGDCVGGFVGTAGSTGSYGTCISNSTNYAYVEGHDYVGGFIGKGWIGNSSPSNPEDAFGTETIKLYLCKNKGSVVGNDNVGGIAGYITRNLNCNGVTLTMLGNEESVSGNNNVGGILGSFGTSYRYSELTLSYNTGNVVGKNRVGGIAGQFSGYFGDAYIINCFNEGLIEGIDSGGGILGYGQGGMATMCVKNCINVGLISGNVNIHGTMGAFFDSWHSGCVTKRENCVCLDTAVVTKNEENVKHLTNLQIKEQSMFTDFDFTSVWGMGDAMPYLLWLDSLFNMYPDDSVEKYIVERVFAYCSNELLEQYEAIMAGQDSDDMKAQKLNELCKYYGLLDPMEGVDYCTNVSQERWAYVAMTTDELYMAWNFGNWLDNTPKGRVAKGSLIASGLIFGGEYSDYLDLYNYVESDFPGIKKYKELLYSFMDNKTWDCEILSYIKKVQALSKKTTDAGQLYASLMIDELNKIQKEYELAKSQEERNRLQDKLMKIIYSDNMKYVIVEYKKQSEKDGEKSPWILSEESGLGQFAKAMGMADKIMSIAEFTIEEIVDFWYLDAKFETFAQHQRFLEEVANAEDLPNEMRWAANQIINELNSGVWGKLKEIGLKILEEVKPISLNKILGTPINEMLFVINVEVYFINKLVDMNALQKSASYVQGYYFLSQHYNQKLKDCKKNFLELPSAENAWEFYYYYNILLRIRAQGEKEFKQMSNIKGFLGKIKTYDYKEKMGFVDSTIKLLDENCVFMIDEGIEIPESVKYSNKTIISCPVNVVVYASDGSIIATLEDGIISDTINSYGRFAVVYRPYLQEFAKVICLNDLYDIRITISGLDSGLLNCESVSVCDTDTINYVTNHVKVNKGWQMELMPRSGKILVDKNLDNEYEDIIEMREVDEFYQPISAVLLNTKELTLNVGESSLLEVNIVPNNATQQKVVWRSYDDIVAIKDGKVTGLTVGETEVYCVSVDNTEIMDICKIKVKKEPTYALSITVPDFTPVIYGYSQQDAKSITIANVGSGDVNISSITVSNSDFLIAGSGTTVTSGGAITSWTVQPVTGLEVGIHTAVITVIYNDGATAETKVTFVVNSASKNTPTIDMFSYTAPTKLFYDGQAKVASILSAKTGIGNMTLKYYKLGETIGTTDAPTDAGTYIVKIFLDEGEEYNAVSDLTADDWMFTIGKAQLTVTADDRIVIAGDVMPKLTYTVSGLVEGESLVVFPTLICTAIDTNTEGNYAITPSGADAGNNYEITFNNGTLTVVAPTQLQHTVTFDSNGGTMVATQTVISGQNAEIPIAPTRSGYIFDGWFSDRELAKAYNFAAMVTTDITLYAKWTVLEPDGGSNSEGGWYSGEASGFWDSWVVDSQRAENAKKELETYFAQYEFRNGMSKADIEQTITEVLVRLGYQDVKVELGNDYTQTDATEQEEGKVSGTLTITCGAATKTLEFNFIINKLPEEVQEQPDLTANEIVKLKGLDLLLVKANPKSKKSVTLKWKNMENADGYEIYWTYCGSPKNYTLLKQTEKLSATQSKMDSKKNYLYYVLAYRVIDGKKVYTAKSPAIHVTMPGNKRTNVQSITVPKTKLTLNIEQRYQIEPTAELEEKGKKALRHVSEYRYFSTDPDIVKVNRTTGKAVAKKKGSCYIYVAANNGVYKRIKITVK